MVPIDSMDYDHYRTSDDIGAHNIRTSGLGD